MPRHPCTHCEDHFSSDRLLQTHIYFVHGNGAFRPPRRDALVPVLPPAGEQRGHDLTAAGTPSTRTVRQAGRGNSGGAQEGVGNAESPVVLSSDDDEEVQYVGRRGAGPQGTRRDPDDGGPQQPRMGFFPVRGGGRAVDNEPRSISMSHLAL